MYKVFGIRHHGPGSSKVLIRALSDYKPDCILIESPADANELISLVSLHDIKPPIAALIYNPKLPAQAVYLPLAEFSPEWQALLFAEKAQIDAAFIDLPQSIQFVHQIPENQDSIETKNKEKLYHDPLAYLADMVGYSDSERWWEKTFEAQNNPIEIFDMIHDLMESLRESDQIAKDLEDDQREAYMRIQIRSYMKKGFERIAVVCGAWHAPALANIEKYKVSHDRKIIKGLRKVNTACSWVPWSYGRLAKKSGYAAGIVSPHWYELLFADNANAVSSWMGMAARLIRKEGFDASTAEVIEAVKLADQIAFIRNLPIPGLDELFEAAISVFTQGEEEKINLIWDEMVVGTAVGEIPSSMPEVPIKKDFDKWLRSTRLTKAKESEELVNKKFDLRKPSNLKASILLHRLSALGIEWGTLKAKDENAYGDFNEEWNLLWKEEYHVQIIESGIYGSSIEEAATTLLQIFSEESANLVLLAQYLEVALKADLTDSLQVILVRLNDIAIQSKDVFQLMQLVPRLVRILRYGSARQVQLIPLRKILKNIIPRICISMPSVLSFLSEDASESYFDLIDKNNRSITLFNNQKIVDQWHFTLSKVAKNDSIHGLLRGLCTRILFEKGKITVKEVATNMLYVFSNKDQSFPAAFWIEGFLKGSALLLIHNPKLWNIIDRWLNELSMNQLYQVLPVLRRAFSRFSKAERDKMMDLALSGFVPDHEKSDYVIPTSELIHSMPLLGELLNFEEE